MLKLTKAVIHQYRCLAADESLEPYEDITALIGKNEAGKTSILEALAKTESFSVGGPGLKFDPEKDYPKRRKRELDREDGIPKAVTLTFTPDKELMNKIAEDIGQRPSVMEFSRTTDYEGNHIVTDCNFNINEERFRDYKKDQDTSKYYENELRWHKPLDEYIYRTYLEPEIPKFLYYDEYNILPERVSIKRLAENKNLTVAERTAKALLLLADTSPEELLECEDMEQAGKELELIEAEFTDKFLKYWKNNQDLRVNLRLVREEKEVEEKGLFFKKKTTVYENFLEVRILNIRDMVALSFEKRSRGFCWFFSFWVWFKAVQKDGAYPFIFLLDEPGLSLHAGAQKDLMDLMFDIAKTNQVIFTTLSPFMLEEVEDKTYCVTCKDHGSVIRKPQNETDYETLMPLSILKKDKTA